MLVLSLCTGKDRRRFTNPWALELVHGYQMEDLVNNNPLSQDITPTSNSLSIVSRIHS